MAYTTVAAETEHETEVRGSRFVARVAPATRRAAAEALLASARERHPDASHHAWAWRIGEQRRFSDDGEPGGTAGRPMLEVLLRRDLDRVAAVVSRYFGGTKLGAGGLVRAYGGSLARALDAAGEITVLDRRRIVVRIPFADADAVFRLVDGWPGLERRSTDHDADGAVLGLSLLERDVAAFSDRIAELSRGAATIEPGEGSAGSPRRSEPS